MLDNAFLPDKPSVDWGELAQIALKGLRAFYEESSGLPHTARLDGSQPRPIGENARYALIALIGLAEAKPHWSEVVNVSAAIQQKLARILSERSLGLGDWGLLMWAQSLDPDSWERDPHLSWQRLGPADVERKVLHADSVELSWVLLGAEHNLHVGGDAGLAKRIGEIAFRALADLYQPQSSLFARHDRPGFLNAVSGRVACFANQIYPLLALACRAERGCEKSARFAEQLLTKLLSLQGPLGQWWWLYDAQSGEVVERYPVFSVHQDGMAPMALLAAARALGCDLSATINRTVQWIHGRNELHQDMVLREHGLILRDIHPRGAGRLTRAAQAAAWSAGWRNRNDERPRHFVVNRECRPYHLGWILYAAALATRQTTRSKMAALQEATV